uniref:Poly [ADP-ribose] polymerase n=1 Tax=Petromyzon marinus TaxID=7757 RepID=S4R8R5_PETMA
CPHLHEDNPFRWQIQMDGQWANLEPNQEIERAFSKPHIHSDSLIGYLDFNTMTCYGPQTRPVRRLSVPSVDRWVWYYRDRYDEWIEFGEENSWGKKSNPDSATIEESYMSDPRCRILYNECQIDFEDLFKQEMCQSVRYNTRPIRRRPQFQTRKSSASVLWSDVPPTPLPEHCSVSPHIWDFEHGMLYTGKLAEWKSGHFEYQNIAKMFNATMASFQITSIVRVNNPLLWDMYQRKKEQMVRDNGKENVNERRLFHVTRTNVQNSICRKNFDFRYAGPKLRNGRASAGSYFSSNAKYAHVHFEEHRIDAGDETCAFLARVLVGVSCPNGMVKATSLLPPAKGGSLENLYDSVVNSLEQPFSFSIFYPSQIYPEYIIKYT